ncbi:proline-rich protein 35 [Rhinophrynus dorsalis]
MSKEEEGGCKLSSACKHKERKPKKPHYIPRPWGKPYNYKCFQCPFTCMEKSHLYNHMKYSLCKNSLSLLIESDWPYKKSNFLIPEMHLLQESQPDGSSDRQEACDSTGSSNTKTRQVGDQGPSEAPKFLDEEEEREEEEEAAERVGKEKVSCLPPLQTSLSKSEATTNVAGLKGKRERQGKEGEPEFIITDVFSLEGQCEKEREEHRHAKASRKSSGNVGGVRADQWKLLTSTLKKGGAEIPAGCTGANIIPCYPPPTYTDYQEHQGLSLLGINYPMNTNLFSYLSPTITSGSGQLPFLASTAQFMHPAHSTQFQALQSTERSSFLPRFYYPLLFEHTLSTAEGKPVAEKLMNQPLPGQMSFVAAPKIETPVENLKTCLLKAPEVKSTVSWAVGDKLAKQTLSHHKLTQEDKWASQTLKDTIQHQKIPSAYIVAAPSIKESSIPQKRTDNGLLWADARCMKRKSWLDKEGTSVVKNQTEILVGEERDIQNSSSCSPSLTSPNAWHQKNPNLEVTGCKRRRGSDSAPASDNTSLLIGDLSRTLEEYGKVERKLANLTSEDNSRQKTLGEQLGKIRLELLHIHHTLQKASCPHEGPLDLSIKRAEDIGNAGTDQTAIGEDPETPPPSECSPKQLMKVELLPPELITCYARPTKCEADSSVLLCPDGRGGSAGVAQTQVPMQEEEVGVGISMGFRRGQQQMENM